MVIGVASFLAYKYGLGGNPKTHDRWGCAGVGVGHGPDMEVWQRWIFRWRTEWPTRQLAGAFDTFVRPRSLDPIVGAIQTLLAELGYAPGPADGLMGQRTRAAIRKFQQDKGLEATGEATDELRVAACAELRRRSLHRPAAPALSSDTARWGAKTLGQR